MGWSSGTELFEKFAAVIIEMGGTNSKSIVGALTALIIILEDHDWEAGENGVDYFKNPYILQALRDLHPDWFEEET